MDDRVDDLRISMADVEDAETAEAVDVLAAVNVAVRIGAGIGPFDDGGRMVDGRRLAVFQEPRIDVIAKGLDRFARDPLRVLRRDLLFADEF
jgi:hypothetical protein